MSSEMAQQFCGDEKWRKRGRAHCKLLRKGNRLAHMVMEHARDVVAVALHEASKQIRSPRCVYEG